MNIYSSRNSSKCITRNYWKYRKSSRSVTSIGSFWRQFGSFWRQFDVIWAILTSIWLHFGQFCGIWLHFGQFCGIWLHFAVFCCICGHFGCILLYLWPFWLFYGCFVANMAVLWPIWLFYGQYCTIMANMANNSQYWPITANTSQYWPITANNGPLPTNTGQYPHTRYPITHTPCTHTPHTPVPPYPMHPPPPCRTRRHRPLRVLEAVHQATFGLNTRGLVKHLVTIFGRSGKSDTFQYGL